MNKYILNNLPQIATPSLPLPVAEWSRRTARGPAASPVHKCFAKAKTQTEADIYIYSPIGDYGEWMESTSANDVQKILADLGDGVKTLNIYINSPGGQVYDGLAIYNQFARHPATKNVVIDGVAASIASVIAMVGDTIRIAENAQIMIHDPETFAWGTARDFRKLADDMDLVKDSIVMVYNARTGNSKDKISKWMEDTTWFTADDAVKNKFANEVIKNVAAPVVNAAFTELAGYSNTPTAFVPPKNLRSKEILARMEQSLLRHRRSNPTQGG